MDFIGTLLTVIFVALLLATALTFGAALFITFMGMAVLVSVGITLRYYWYRWRFLHSTKQDNPPGVIDAEYHEISNGDEK